MTKTRESQDNEPVHHQSTNTPLTPVFKHPGGPSLSTLGYYGGTSTELRGDSLLPVPHDSSCPKTPELQLRTLYTPGHAEDHTCFLLEEVRQQKPLALFTGDCILGHGSTTVNNLHLYMQSLHRLKSLVDTAEEGSICMMPAHGLEITRPQVKIAEYIANREQRIAKVAEFFALRPVTHWFNEVEILNYVYPEIPQSLEKAALLNLRHSLYWLSTASRLVGRSSASKLQLDEEQFRAMLNAWETASLTETEGSRLGLAEQMSSSRCPSELLQYWEWCSLSPSSN